ncbi:MAG: hypothetical protein ACKPGT_32210 [Microcystis sp.]|uniref:hypothetical protein n=1 Tax=Microcystis aeruginosa TaxID=1126 RepID=UPI0003187537|nr:hypothetical protein [Microcystis aeruginosa]
MVRSPKSIAGAVGATLGNAPYGDGVLLRSAFGIPLHWGCWTAHQKQNINRPQNLDRNTS